MPNFFFNGKQFYLPQKHELSMVLYSWLWAYASKNDVILLAIQNLGRPFQGAQTIFKLKLKKYVCDCCKCWCPWRWVYVSKIWLVALMWRVPFLLCNCSCGYRTCPLSTCCPPAFSENRLTFIASCQSDLFFAVGTSSLLYLTLNLFLLKSYPLLYPSFLLSAWQFIICCCSVTCQYIHMSHIKLLSFIPPTLNGQNPLFLYFIP